MVGSRFCYSLAKTSAFSMRTYRFSSNKRPWAFIFFDNFFEKTKMPLTPIFHFFSPYKGLGGDY
jgi:hypothetical protein